MKLILIASVVSAVALSVRAAESMWNFDADAAGQIASGFSNEAGAWKVVADESAPSKPNVLAQTAESANAVFNIALATGSSFKDVDLSVRMKAVAGETDQGGGVVWRARDAKNYYIARFNPLEDNFRVYKVEDGVRKQLGDATLKAAPGWHTLRARMIGAHIECFFDGQKYLDVSDTSFAEAGRVGLWSKADARTHFDDLIAKDAK